MSSFEKIPPEKVALLERFMDGGSRAAEKAGISYVILAKFPDHQEVMMETGGSTCVIDLEGEKAAMMAFFMQWAMSQAAKATMQ